ncbi:hypothetical protein AMTR_s00028p00236680, partial [Amborella trichopoda]
NTELFLLLVIPLLLDKGFEGKGEGDSLQGGRLGNVEERRGKNEGDGEQRVHNRWIGDFRKGEKKALG